MVNGKISLIKNSKGEDSFPVTSSEAVYMKDGVTTVEKKIEDINGKKLSIEEFNTYKEENRSTISNIENDIVEVNSQLETNTSVINIINNNGITVSTSNELIEAIKSKYKKIVLKNNNYIINETLTIESEIQGNYSNIQLLSSITSSSSCKLYNINFKGINREIDGILLKGGCIIENCTFYTLRNAIKQVGICVHTKIKKNTFGYNLNGVVLDCPGDTSCNNLILEENYFVKQGTNADDLSANGTESENNYVGVGLILKDGCNSVIVQKNVFEYNTFCGIILASEGNSKTNDSRIFGNYFEGNKIMAMLIMSKGTVTGNQYSVSDNFYSIRMTDNVDFKNEGLIVRGIPSSYYPIKDKYNSVALMLGGSNNIFDENKYCISIGKMSQYISLLWDRYSRNSPSERKVVMVYKSRLNTSVTLRDGNQTSILIHTFDASESEVTKTVTLTMPNNINKYLNRVLQDDEYIYIYKYYTID